MRLFIPVVLLSASAFAQIDLLTTTDSGSDVYFVTSKLRQTGTNGAGGPQLFRLSAGQLTRIGGEDTELVRPSVSGDGTVLAVNTRMICQSCAGLFTYSYRVDRAGVTQSGDGAASVSPNGRYIAVLGLSFPQQPDVKVIDLTTGAVVASGPLPAQDGRFVANDGTLLSRSATNLRLIRPSGATTDLPAVPFSSPISLAGDASSVLYVTSQRRVGVVNVATASSVDLGPGLRPSLASNGRSVSYLTDSGDLSFNPKEIWLADPASGAKRKLADIPEGAVDQVISGDGLTVIASTLRGRLLKIDTTSGAATELLKATGPPFFIMRSAVPGSYNELIPSPNLAPDLADVHVTVDGREARVFGTTPRGVAFQVPWEARAIPEAKVIVQPPELKFEQVVPTGVSERFVFFIPLAQDSIRGPYYFAAHEDWQRLVSLDNPARPGEVIHMYSMGWGPVDGSIPTGQPTPSDRLYRITAQCTWRAHATLPPQGGQPLEVLFSGLAPGLIGLFQQDFRVPANWSADRLMFECAPFVTPDSALVIPIRP